MNVKPARGIILVEPIKDTDKTTTGVYLPESAKDKPMKGKVVAVGDITWEKYFKCKEFNVKIQQEKWLNDIVFFKKWGNEEIKEDNKEYVFLREEDILGIQDATK